MPEYVTYKQSLRESIRKLESENRLHPLSQTELEALAELRDKLDTHMVYQMESGCCYEE